MMGESSGHENLESMLKDGRSEQRNLPLEYLRDITDNFCDERRLGKGGFGTVYKGVLENGEEIAIKKLNTSMLETMDREFENEVKHLTRLKHPNVVVLVGWCSEAENTYVKYKGKYVCAEKQQRLLCFEYMPKGDLRGYLSDASSGLGWDTRYKIIEGICYGLCHLHEGCQPNATIVHMDLKPENILLDNNMMPKIADFGLSRLFDVDKIWKITSSRGGTLGYMSREYIHNGRISTKSDIFSLGVIIIEIVTGHRDYPDDTGTPSKEFIEMVLHNWSQRKRIKNIFGLSLEVDYEQIRRCIQIGLDCVHTDWSRRPTISQIIKALHGQGSADSPAVPRKTSGGLIPTDRLDSLFSPRCVWVNGPIIVGAGPSGLAVAACLREQGVPYVILERADCIASRWQKRTYDRLKLHLPKQFHELPRMPFPDHYPEYPTRRQFIDYLQDYASMFEIKPEFSTTVKSARYDETSGLWRVVTSAPYISGEMEYIGRWLVVATGENAESVVPDIPGLDGFDGKVTHVSDYKSGEAYAGKRVLVVGCGNSGMEVSLDLSDHGARPAMVVRDAVHVLPCAVLGTSTFKLAVLLMRWLPLWIVDKIMVLLAWLVLGNLAKLGLRRPAAGPFELMLKHGRTPVLDYSTVGCIRAGYIAVVPAITRFGKGGQVELVDGRTLNFDAVILATGYRSNVPQWLQGNDFFNKDGFPKTSLSGDGDEGRRGLFSASAGWKGQSRLYAVGFTRRGLSSASADAVRVAKDLGNVWREETKPTKRARACHRRCIQQVF